jgi:uncharacterized protein (DUF1330 family)
MPAYVTALVTVTNQQEILTYAKQVDPTVAQYGGRFIVKGGPVAEVLEGDLLPHTVTILEFPTLDRAQAWYRSPEYRDIIHHRHEGAAVRSFSFSIPNHIDPHTSRPLAPAFDAICAVP